MKHVLMACGHTAQGIDGDGHPVCAICYGLAPLAKMVAADTYGLTGRVAECPYCRHTAASSVNLPFFEYRPERPTDSWYCGCLGWD